MGLLMAILVDRLPAQITTFPWTSDLSSPEPFVFVNGDEPNYWSWGENAGNDVPALYITTVYSSANNNYYWTTGDPWGPSPAYSCSHAYLDVSFPDSMPLIILKFDVRVAGEADWDQLQLYITPVGYTPNAGSQVYTEPGYGNYHLGGPLYGIPGWQQVTYVLSPSFAGSTKRIIFSWRNDSSNGTQPPAAIDNIMIDVGHCAAPYAATVHEVTATTASLSWSTVPAIDEHHYELRTTGEPGSGPIGLAAFGTVEEAALDLAGLAGGTQYWFYVQGGCEGGYTEWSSHVEFVTDPACGSLFHDSGGASDGYGANEDCTYIICPDDPGEAATVQFIQILISSGDIFKVYDGPEASGAPAAVFPMGTYMNYEITSDHPTGCLAFRLITNAMYHGDITGIVNCGPYPDCDVWALHAVEINATSASLDWQCTGSEVPYYVEYGPVGFDPGSDVLAGEGTIVTSLSTDMILEDLIPGETYEAYVRAYCPNIGTIGPNHGPVSFTTLPDCGADHHDSGGGDNTYAPYEQNVQMICPNAVGLTPILTFSEFVTEPFYDVLYIFDGPDTDSPIHSSGGPSPITLPNFGPGGWWGQVLPGPFISTHPSGCFTMAFISDGNVQLEGWSAHLECGTVNIMESMHHEDFDLFPNPVAAGSFVELTLPEGVSSDLYLIDAKGVMIQDRPYVDKADPIRIKIPQVESGLYFLRIMSQDPPVSKALPLMIE
jgi:hypothetical protein